MDSMRHRIPICPHETRDHLSALLVALLEKTEKRVLFELTFSSGLRCPECNATAGGSQHSAHITGEAVDISIASSQLRYALLAILFDLGVKRLGIGKSFLHVDVNLTLPQHVTWLY